MSNLSVNPPGSSRTQTGRPGFFAAAQDSTLDWYAAASIRASTADASDGLDLEQPALAVRVGVHQLRGAVERLVDRDDLAAERRVDVADRLGRLQLADGVTARQVAADLGQRDVDDVAERVLRVVGDADPDGARPRRGPTRARWCTSGRRGTRCSSPLRSVDREQAIRSSRARRTAASAACATLSTRTCCSSSTVTLPPTPSTSSTKPPVKSRAVASVCGSPIASMTYGAWTRCPSTSTPPPAASTSDVCATTRT